MKAFFKKFSRRVRKLFMTKATIRESWVKGPAGTRSDVEFHSWFDKTSSVEETVMRARSDWEQRICKFESFEALPKGTCLEIGFGGGRLLKAASATFDLVMGVDIHDAFDRTRQFLDSQGVANYRLYHRRQLAEIPSGSVDFVFSFIVFQHFDTFEEVDFYLSEINRVLKEGRLAHIFFGKCPEVGVRVTRDEDFWKRACSLFVEPGFFREQLSKSGFEVLEFEDLMPKRVDQPLSETNQSGQARVLFRKRKP